MTSFLKDLWYDNSGDAMKRFLSIIGFALLVGAILAFFFYKDINEEVKALVKKEEVVTLFQVGVFKDKENAYKFASAFTSSCVYEDNSYYRVIIGISYHEETKVKLEEIFLNDGIEYYLKETRVNKDLITKLNNYETILLKTNKKEVVYNILNSMLELYLSNL